MLKKRVLLKSIFTVLLIFAVLSLLVYAFQSVDITLLAPAAGFWLNDTINTEGFNYSFVINADSSLETADCTLFIQNTTTAGILTGENNSYNTDFGIGNNTVQNILMNHSLVNVLNASVYYWTLQCINLSSSPTSASASPRVFYQDVIFPNVSNHSMNFANNSFINVIPRLEVIFQDLTPNFTGELHTAQLLNGTTILVNISAQNNTPVNLTNITLDDGVYSDLRYQIIDPAGNINKSNGIFWNISVDTTDPIITFVVPTPDNQAIITTTTITFNFTVDEPNVDVIIVEFDGVNLSANNSDEFVGLNLSSGTSCNNTVFNEGPVQCNVTNSSVGDKKDYIVKVFVNDTAGNSIQSDIRNFTVDNNFPVFDQINNIYTVNFLIII